MGYYIDRETVLSEQNDDEVDSPPATSCSAVDFQESVLLIGCCFFIFNVHQSLFFVSISLDYRLHHLCCPVLISLSTWK